MDKYKAMTVIREQIISDVNHASWRTNKVKVLNLSHDSANNPKQATISYKDVLYDVDFITWKVANVRMADNKEAASEAQTDKDNERWFQRQYKVAVEHMRDTLRPHIYLNAEAVGDGDNALLFRFSNAWTGSISALMSYIHHYIVDFILYEWFRMTMPNEASSYLTTSEDWKAKAVGEAQSEEENFDWFERQLATAVDHLKDRLHWCIRSCDVLDETLDDTIKKTTVDNEVLPIESYTFRFKFSPEWRGNFESLGNYMHRYIVDYILYEWFKITLPSEAAVYLTSAEQWESKIINEARSEDVRNVYFRL